MTFTKKQHQEFLEQMKIHTAETIRTTVNGKIDDLKKTTLTKEDFAVYVKADMAWKVDAQPSLDNMKNITGIWKAILGLSLSIATIGGAIAVARKILNI